MCLLHGKVDLQGECARGSDWVVKESQDEVKRVLPVGQFVVNNVQEQSIAGQNSSHNKSPFSRIAPLLKAITAEITGDFCRQLAMTDKR